MAFFTTYYSTQTSTFPNPVAVQGTFPFVALIGSETNGQSEQIVEVTGDLWILKNAQYNGSQFTPINTSLAAYAVKHAATGAFQLYSAVAGTSPITWVSLWSVDGSGNATFLSVTATAPSTFTSLTASGNITSTAGVISGPTISATTAMTLAGTSVVTNITSSDGSITLTRSPVSTYNAVIAVYPRNPQAQTGWQNVPAATTVAGALLGTVTLSLPNVLMTFTNWRVYVTARAQFAGGAASPGATLGITTASAGTSPINEFAAGAGTHILTATGIQSDQQIGLFAAGDNWSIETMYIATYANGANLSFSAYGYAGAAVATSGWIGIYAVPQ